MKRSTLIIPIDGKKIELKIELPKNVKFLSATEDIDRAAQEFFSARQETDRVAQNVAKVRKARELFQYDSALHPGQPGYHDYPVWTQDKCGGFFFNIFKGKTREYFLLFEDECGSEEEILNTMGLIFKRFHATLCWHQMAHEERIIAAENGVVYYLSPEELYRWADAEQRAGEAEAEIAALGEKVGSHDLSGRRDREDGTLEAILKQLPAEDQVRFFDDASMKTKRGGQNRF